MGNGSKLKLKSTRSLKSLLFTLLSGCKHRVRYSRSCSLPSTLHAQDEDKGNACHHPSYLCKYTNCPLSLCRLTVAHHFFQMHRATIEPCSVSLCSLFFSTQVQNYETRQRKRTALIKKEMGTNHKTKKVSQRIKERTQGHQ